MASSRVKGRRKSWQHLPHEEQQLKLRFAKAGFLSNQGLFAPLNCTLNRMRCGDQAAYGAALVSTCTETVRDAWATICGKARPGKGQIGCEVT
jgi:hypothetical protein